MTGIPGYPTRRYWRRQQPAGCAMIGILGLLLALLLLAGCGLTSEGSLIRDTVKNEGAKVYDQGIRNAIWFICQGASHGAVERYFGQSWELANAHETICKGAPNVNLLAPTNAIQ